MLVGIDISYWQSSAPLGQAPDFVIIRATYGTSVDSRCIQHHQAARSAGKLVGFYHNAQPEGNDAIQEADAFINQVREYLGEATLWLDFEATDNALWGRGQVERDWIHTWVYHVHEQTGVWPGLYVQASAVARLYPAVSDVAPLWIALWPGITSFGSAINHGLPDGYGPVTLWQFTSGLDGGSLDGDLFNGDVDAWNELAAGTGGYAPSLAAPQEPVGRNITGRPTADIQRLVGADPDGIYGPDTTAKVRAWQAAHGLEADGIWGPLSDAAGFPPTEATLRQGDTGDRVRALQAALNKVFPAYSRLAVDGDFGPRTAAVVREFQVRAGLVADGIVGPLTTAALNRYGVWF